MSASSSGPSSSSSSSSVGRNPIARFFSYFFFDNWRKIDADTIADAPAEPQAAAVAGPGKPGKRNKGKRKSAAAPAVAATGASVRRPYPWQIIAVLVTVAVSLSMQEYYGERQYFYKWFGVDKADEYLHLKAYAWWSGWRFLGYVVIPMITIALMPGERIRDYYVSTRGFFKHLWIYVLLFLLILGPVAIAAQTEAFYKTYPFYKLSNRSAFDFWAWQGLYWLQFLSLEFFFRGYMLHGLSRVLGSKAIFVMIVPYCMIHFGKPFPETIGAIGAGIILGTLAMRTRSIWGGVVIHVGVAFTMDYLALSHCPSWEETGRQCIGK